MCMKTVNFFLENLWLLKHILDMQKKNHRQKHSNLQSNDRTFSLFGVVVAVVEAFFIDFFHCWPL